VRRLVRLFNEVCHPNDFVLLVVFYHFSFLDNRHEVLSMADLALQSTPDLQDKSLAHDIWQRTRFAT
jgi:hypothetical protein